MKRILAIVTFAATLASPALAAYPEKPVTMVVPFPPGGSSDMVARAIAPKLQEKLGQPFVTDNRAGATGAIGATMVKNAAADGYTILVASIGVYAINPFIQKKLQYDPVKDLDPITVAVRAPNVLVASPNFSANSVAELVAALKKTPGKIGFASSGAGSSDHLTAALNDPENRKRMEEIGFEIVADTPEQMAQFQAQELERWRQVIEVGKIEFE